MTLPSLDQPTPLLGGLSPDQFMRRHWQRKPLLIRQALADWRSPVTPAALRRLACNDDVESRLVWREQGEWRMASGPFLPPGRSPGKSPLGGRQAEGEAWDPSPCRLPRANQPDWTLLVQGVDLFDERIAALRDRFRFIPDARLDDAMISLASQGGGVGPHFDSYDVFLLQARGRRRWQVSQQRDLSLQPDLPLKVLANFTPEAEYVLEPGDMLYLPPHVAHDGVAETDDCMTISIGFRSPSQAELARLVLDLAAERLLDDEMAGKRAGRYRDPGQPATLTPAALPERLCQAARDEVARLRFDDALVADALGRWLSEPKAGVVFDGPEDAIDLIDAWPVGATLVLDSRTRLLYRGKRGYINGEILESAMTTDLCRLADERRLVCSRRPPSAGVRELLQDWLEGGWLHDQRPL